MANLKRAWITPHTPDLVSLSLASAHVDEQHRLDVTSMAFPAVNPDKHTICVSLLDADDLIAIRCAIDRYFTRTRKP